MSAVITDGTFYQDPEEDPKKKYNNVCSKASNMAIATNGGEWQKITLPFDYANMDANADLKARAILLTMSTCSVAGCGSKDKKKPDCLYIDDVELVYNYLPTSISSMARNCRHLMLQRTDIPLAEEVILTFLN